MSIIMMPTTQAMLPVRLFLCEKSTVDVAQEAKGFYKTHQPNWQPTKGVQP